MPQYVATLTIILLFILVLSRIIMLKRAGIEAMNFGKIDKKDFLIPPFALFYFYIILANTFNLPSVSKQELFSTNILPWIGVGLCLAGLTLFLLSLIAFGKSFRVGIDNEHPDELITNGVFSYTRNPLYVAFVFVLLGQFLIFTNWILLIYLGAACWLINRQILREEEYLKRHYGQQYLNYCAKVRRYI